MCVLFVLRKAPIMRATNSRLMLVDVTAWVKATMVEATPVEATPVETTLVEQLEAKALRARVGVEKALRITTALHSPLALNPLFALHSMFESRMARVRCAVC